MAGYMPQTHPTLMLLLDTQAKFFLTFMAGLSRFMAAFRLSQKTEEKVFFG